MLLGPEPNDGSRSGLRARGGGLLWLCRGNPRTRSSLRSRLRLCHRDVSAIRRLRCRTGSGSPRGRRLGTLIDIYRRRCLCWHHFRRCLRCGLATEPKRLSHRRTARGISRGGERMIVPLSPTLQIFIPAQALPRADVPSQGLAPIAAIQAHHVVLMNGSPHRYGGNQNFLGRNGLSKLTERLIHGRDEIRKLLRSHSMLDDVALDDHCC